MAANVLLSVQYIPESPNWLAPMYYQYDALGHVTRSQKLATYGAIWKFESDPAGDVIKQTETRRSQFGSDEYTTRFVFDEHGRLRKLEDPLSVAGPDHEPNTDPATIDYVLENGLMKVTHTSREHLKSYQWFNGAGQLVKGERKRGRESLW